jgi:hypothetical protein
MLNNVITSMVKFRYWLLAVWLSIQWMFRTTLGDEVIYQGEKHVVYNGTMCESWRIGEKDGQEWWVKRKDCRKVYSLRGMMRSFRSGYFFYMSSWYGIWVSQGIPSWTRSLPIW